MTPLLMDRDYLPDLSRTRKVEAARRIRTMPEA